MTNLAIDIDSYLNRDPASVRQSDLLPSFRSGRNVYMLPANPVTTESDLPVKPKRGPKPKRIDITDINDFLFDYGFNTMSDCPCELDDLLSGSGSWFTKKTNTRNVTPLSVLVFLKTSDNISLKSIQFMWKCGPDHAALIHQQLQALIRPLRKWMERYEGESC